MLPVVPVIVEHSSQTAIGVKHYTLPFSHVPSLIPDVCKHLRAVDAPYTSCNPRADTAPARVTACFNITRKPPHRMVSCFLPVRLLIRLQYVHKHPLDPRKRLLSLLPSEPANPHLAIGTCDSLPVTPRNFETNPNFLPILSSVFAAHATSDPDVQSQAAVFASPGGSFLSQPSDGAGGANHQGGAGGAGHGGWIHVSDLRNPPDYGRIAWPEDIIGSIEVDGNGKFAGGDGNWQDSGTYRVVTREGM
jgi:hypothetical protein